MPQTRQYFSVLLSQPVLLIIVLASLVPSTRAYYCDDNLCSSEQFCCGENVCCDFVNNNIWWLVCAFISVIVCGIVLWGFFQLFLVLIAIYFGSRHQQRHIGKGGGEEGHLEDSENEHHHLPSNRIHQSGFLADIENGDVSLMYIVKKFLNLAFNNRRGKGKGNAYLYSSSSFSHTTKQSSSHLSSSSKQAASGPPTGKMMSVSLMNKSYKKEDKCEEKKSSH